MQRESFVLYSEYIDHIAELSNEQRGMLFTAILNYVNGVDIPDMDSVTKMAFSFIKKQLDRDADKWEGVRQSRSEAGKKGMAKRWGEKDITKDNGVKSVITDDITKITNITVNDNVNVDVNVDEDVINTPYTPSGGKGGKFVPPTPEAVDEYCRERGNDIDGNEFVDFYASKGWQVGKNRMKDWKAAVRTWERNRGFKPTPKPPEVEKIPYDEDDDEARNRLYEAGYRIDDGYWVKVS